MSSNRFLNTSIGKKLVMAITGLFLILYLIVHVGINSLIFLNDNGVIYNKAAHFMSHNILIRIMEVVLLTGFLIHIFQSLRLSIENRKARPIRYELINADANSKWYSRSMGVLGSLLLIFLVVHMSELWISTKIAVFKHQEHNTFEEMKILFSYWYIVVIYIFGVISLFFHILHGFPSAFQTLGINHKKYTPYIKKIGIWFSVIVCALFVLMPITMFLGMIK
jgi:succinate dehydrogenase / fumarate reductase cytochrome b subunit